VDAPVLDQPLERDPRRLAADRVERGQHDGLGGVVDDDVHAGGLLEGADVAALPADDAALHLVGRELDDRHRRLGGEVGGHALDGEGDDLARLALGFALSLLLDLADRVGGLGLGGLGQILQELLAWRPPP
jgi:hypothetical protein